MRISCFLCLIFASLFLPDLHAKVENTRSILIRSMDTTKKRVKVS